MGRSSWRFSSPPNGYHKITWVLRRRYRLVISFKKVYRLLKSMALLWSQRRCNAPHPRRLARNWVVTRAEPTVGDGHHLWLHRGQRSPFYLQAILNVYDRQIIAYLIVLSCQAADTARPLAHVAPSC